MKKLNLGQCLCWCFIWLLIILNIIQFFHFSQKITLLEIDVVKLQQQLVEAADNEAKEIFSDPDSLKESQQVLIEKINQNTKLYDQSLSELYEKVAKLQNQVNTIVEYLNNL